MLPRISPLHMEVLLHQAFFDLPVEASMTSERMGSIIGQETETRNIHDADLHNAAAEHRLSALNAMCRYTSNVFEVFTVAKLSQWC